MIIWNGQLPWIFENCRRNATFPISEISTDHSDATNNITKCKKPHAHFQNSIRKCHTRKDKRTIQKSTVNSNDRWLCIKLILLMPKLLSNNNVFFYYCDIHKEMSMTAVVVEHLDWDFLEKWRHIKIERRSQFYMK